MNKTDKKQVVLLVGPPGSGKSSVAVKLKEKAQIALIGTGNLLRAEVTNKTAIAEEVQNYLDKGMFVPTELVVKVVLQKINKIKNDIILFDGFPRVEEQIDSFLKICNEANLSLKAVIVLDVSRETIIKRLSGRRVCTKCNEIYNIYFNPPPEENKCKCGGKLEMRDDDKPEVVENRLNEYEKNTLPVIKYFKEKCPGILYFIRGEESLEESAEKILSLIS